MRIVIIGNAGSGKTTLAKVLSRRYQLAHLPLDEVAWDLGTNRLPIEQSIAMLDRFRAAHSSWVIEGVYGLLVSRLLPYSSELLFLNPGIEACLANCRRRPWEPTKFENQQQQQEMLETLLIWVSDYVDREDDTGLSFHRKLFMEFTGDKTEYECIEDYPK